MTSTTKYEDLSPEDIINNYIRLKEKERERNKQSYEKLKENKAKYFNRLNENLAYQLERVETFKSDEQRLQEFKTRRKDINKRAYEKRKLLKSKSE
jgi:uncharacterized hydantoinase/oxoprolinase family protein